METPADRPEPDFTEEDPRDAETGDDGYPETQHEEVEDDGTQ